MPDVSSLELLHGHNPQERIIGTLTIAGPLEKVQPHTLGMVVTAVSAIETQLKLQKALHSLEYANNYKNAVMESISEGILAVDFEGTVTHINNIMARYLGLSQEKTGEKFKDLLNEKNKDLFDIVQNNRIVTDHEIDIYADDSSNTFLITTRPIHGDEVREGLVLLINEIKRAQKLAQRMSGPKDG